MKRRSAFVSFIKAIVLMQFFFLALLAGLSWDINSNLEYSRNLRIPETYMSLFKVKISREMAQSALRLNNVAMAGINSPQLAWRDYLNAECPRQL
ncbi:hypothetical protein [Syntrophomonas palmitatica]|uniref:hypothetical protein n=1 Tax=Syntrophomonas palmitatica TaxID=402877 RepID=UPI0006D059AE|nr:hypothetical protein [Syntrophomonas palmitatica]